MKALEAINHFIQIMEPESSTIRLEDGEIDERNDNEFFESIGLENVAKVTDSLSKDAEKADKVQNDETPAKATVLDADSNDKLKHKETAETFNYQKDYLNEPKIDYIDEDEMLCVRGASPVEFVVERRSYRRKSPPQDYANISIDITPPKKRKTSGKRRRKRTTPKKVVKSISSDEKNNSNCKERSESPLEVREKLSQLCKFYLLDNCAKRSKCEYMHSEFPCKFFYLGLKCVDEMTETGCKLAHGGLLSSEMLKNLTRHIHTAPVDVLGQEFVNLRSKMSSDEINQKLQHIQENFKPPESEQNEVSSSQVDSSDFFNILKNKLYFLNENQLKGLQELGMTKVDDLLNLTIAQLNAIGIFAIQIESIQMSFATLQDTDMRSILPRKSETTIQQVPSFEIVCFNEGETYGQNWIEEEEQPLVIDESNADKDNAPDSDDIIIDVLGDSNTESNCSQENKEETSVNDNKMKDEDVEAIICEEFLYTSEQVALESTQVELEVSSNTNNTVEKNHKELQIFERSDDLEKESGPVICQETKDKAENDNNAQDATDNVPVVQDIVIEQIDIEILQEEAEPNDTDSLKENIIQHILKEDERNYTPPLMQIEIMKEDKSCVTPPPIPIESPKENKRCYSPQSDKIVAEIDLTTLSPPKRQKDIPQRGYINPFQRKAISPVKETRKRYSPVKVQRKQYSSRSNFKQDDYKMQGDDSSEDWDADERSDIQSPPKEIASPDQSEDESTPFVPDGTCPELPRRTKNLENYQPASEINAHLTYPPMEYKLFEIYMPEYEINKPTLIDKLVKANSTDPRLKKFLEKEKNHGVFPEAEYSFFPPDIPQCDPRHRPGCGNSCPDQNYNASRILYSYLQNSQWYQELKSNLKIQINHSVSDLVRALNYFHKDPSPQKYFDVFQIECAGVLLEVMRNVGIFIDVNGNITEESNYKRLSAAPLQQQQPPQTFGNSPGFSVQHPKPGLLGFAPPGVSHPHANNLPMSNEQNNFARQAFGIDYFCSNNNDLQPNYNSFYVGGRIGMNCEPGPDFNSGFQPRSHQRQNQKRNFKRH